MRHSVSSLLLCLSAFMAHTIAALPRSSTYVVDMTNYLPAASGSNSVRGVYMRTSDDAKQASATSVIIAIHGLPRTSAAMYSSTAAAAPSDAYIFSVRFCNEGDQGVLTGSTMVWSGSSWITGGTSTNGGLSSYDILDGVAKMAHDKTLFPKVTKVSVIGHSAGAQLSVRYAALIKDASMVNQFLVYNPGTSLYLTADRYKDPASSACANTYNNWKYGLVNYNGDYNAAAVSTDSNRRKVAFGYGNKKIHWFFGDKDTEPATDNNCEAQLGGGSTRYGRGLVFWMYLNAYFATGADVSKYKQAASSLGLTVDFSKIRTVGCTKTYKLTHTIDIVPGVGHDEYKMVNCDASKSYLGA